MKTEQWEEASLCLSFCCVLLPLNYSSEKRLWAANSNLRRINQQKLLPQKMMSQGCCCCCRSWFHEMKFASFILVSDLNSRTTNEVALSNLIYKLFAHPRSSSAHSYKYKHNMQSSKQISDFVYLTEITYRLKTCFYSGFQTIDRNRLESESAENKSIKRKLRTLLVCKLAARFK